MHKPEVLGVPKRLETASFENFKVYPEINKTVKAVKDEKASVTLCGATGAGKSHLAVAKIKSLQPILLQEEFQGYALEVYTTQKERYLAYPDASEQKVNEYFKPLIEDEGYKYRPARAIFLSTVKYLMTLNDHIVKGEGRLDKIETYVKPVEVIKSKNVGKAFEYSGFDYIVLDDFGAEKMSEASRQNLYYLINERYENMGNVIVTSNVSIEQMKDNEPRIASRLAEMGMIAEINIPDYRTRRDK